MNTKLATSRMRTAQWADIIKDCKESGLKVDDYCAQHGLSRNAYFYWLRKVKEAALTQSGFVGSTATGGGFLLLSISKVNSVRKRNSFRD